MKLENEKLTIFNDSKIKILKTLIECEECLCGCDLVESLDMPKNLLSYHLKSLIELGFIQEDKCGRKKNYSIKKERLDLVKRIFKLIEEI